MKKIINDEIDLEDNIYGSYQCNLDKGYIEIGDPVKITNLDEVFMVILIDNGIVIVCDDMDNFELVHCSAITQIYDIEFAYIENFYTEEELKDIPYYFIDIHHNYQELYKLNQKAKKLLLKPDAFTKK